MSNNSLDRLDFRRMGLLSQDTMIIKEKVFFDKHGIRIVGTTDDTLNENGIDMELKLLAKKKKYEKKFKNKYDGDFTGEENIKVFYLQPLLILGTLPKVFSRPSTNLCFFPYHTIAQRRITLFFESNS